MKRIKAVWIICAMILWSSNANCQDSLYARHIDSLFYNKNSRSKQIFVNAAKRIGDAKFNYEYYKNSKKIRTIQILNRKEKELIIFFYIDDKIAMISPVGQQPYYILNDKLFYGSERKHTPMQIVRLIERANEYLSLANNEWRQEKEQ